MKAFNVGGMVLCPGCGCVLRQIGEKKYNDKTPFVFVECSDPTGGFQCEYRGRNFKVNIPTIDIELQEEVRTQ